MAASWSAIGRSKRSTPPPATHRPTNDHRVGDPGSSGGEVGDQPVEVTGVGAELRHGRSCRRRRLATGGAVPEPSSARWPGSRPPATTRPHPRPLGSWTAYCRPRPAGQMTSPSSPASHPTQTAREGRWWAQGSSRTGTGGRRRQAPRSRSSPPLSSALLRHNPNTLPPMPAGVPAIPMRPGWGSTLERCWTSPPALPSSHRPRPAAYSTPAGTAVRQHRCRFEANTVTVGVVDLEPRRSDGQSGAARGCVYGPARSRLDGAGGLEQ